MVFKITHEIRDQIVFAMENQNRSYVFDSETLQITFLDTLPEDVKIGEDEKYISIPLWTSADGFRLMEKFVSNLHNPIFREKLRQALASGKGVFRTFKNVLKERADMERLWYAFKEKEMRQRVGEWYSQLCEYWGYSQIGPEPEDTEALVQSDFDIIPEREGDFEQILVWDKEAFSENYPKESSAYIEYLYTFRRRVVENPGRRILVAETQGKDFAGYIWGVDEALEDDAPGVARIIQLYILKEYRGLGVARLLLDKYIRDSFESGCGSLLIEMGGEALAVERSFAARGFVPVTTELSLDLDKWGKENSLEI